MKTERTLELLKHFRDFGIIHKGTDLELINEYQDCIMGSSRGDIAKFEHELDKNTRQLFFWVNANTLGMDSFLDILKTTYIRRKGNEIIEVEILKEDKRYNDNTEKLKKEMLHITEQKAIFENCKKPIYKKIADLRNTIRQLSDDLDISNAVIDRLETESTKLYRSAKQNAEKAEKYDNIKSLLN